MVALGQRERGKGEEKRERKSRSAKWMRIGGEKVVEVVPSKEIQSGRRSKWKGKQIKSRSLTIRVPDTLYGCGDEREPRSERLTRTWPALSRVRVKFSRLPFPRRFSICIKRSA